MVASKDLKRRIRQRQATTGESYTAARMHVLGDQMQVLAPTEAEPSLHEAAILRVNDTSARIRVLGDDSRITFRPTDASDLKAIAPGHVVSLVVDKRWTWNGEAHAGGRIEGARIDAARLGLTPLGLDGGELEDIREYSEPCRGRDEYSKLWRKLTAKPRASYEFDELAWGSFPDADPEDNPTCDAAELREAGRVEEAYDLLMATLERDLRVLDAHAGLGNIAFDEAPERAIVHYEMGVRIGELSLPTDFDGLLVWGRLYNRAFLRCLHGYGLCLWRRGDHEGARSVFERILSLNPDDHQGVRFCWNDVRRGRSWDAMQKKERDAQKQRRQYLH